SRELRRRGTSARVLPVLRQRRVVADQSGLNSRQRLANLTGALETAPGAARLLAGHRAVLVDDLMTTGASLTEAARALSACVTSGQAPGEPREMSRTCRTYAAVVAASPDSFEINRN
ncbi:phosphoribosyltransferase family protein, partial [Streptomyces sp. T-3]|nr:phosphoribosyltransferase family protein [Streptomyces sp. T-3]